MLGIAINGDVDEWIESGLLDFSRKKEFIVTWSYSIRKNGRWEPHYPDSENYDNLAAARARYDEIVANHPGYLLQCEIEQVVETYADDRLDRIIAYR